MAWHGGEAIVRLIKPAALSVLSSRSEIRNTVYESIGITLIAAALVCVPIPAIQLIALPILIGSLYGIINNQFTVRECPEYYTMGHHYDGTSLKDHAITTNNLAIKPIVTGCYATTFVSKIIGIVLSATGTLPYTAAVLPVPYAAVAIGGFMAVSLAVAHIISGWQKKSMQKSLETYAKLVGTQIDDTKLNMTWYEFVQSNSDKIEDKRQQLAEQPEELKKYNAQLEKIAKRISWNDIQKELKDYAKLIEVEWKDEYLNMKGEDFLRLHAEKRYAKSISLLSEEADVIYKFNKKEKDLRKKIKAYTPMPIKYQIGWWVNSCRNGVGYGGAGIGTLALTISTVVMRLFVF